MEINVKGYGKLEVPDGFRDMSEGARQKIIANRIEKAKNKDLMSEGAAAARFGLGQGVALGFGDEIEGYARSLINNTSYKDERDKIRAEMDAYRDANAKKALGYELGGGLLTGIGGLARAGAAATGRAALKQATKYGAGTGALAGAGAADEISDVPVNAIGGAAIGGTLSAALPLAANVVGRGAKAVRGALDMTSDKAAQKQADLKLLEAFEKEGMSPTDALRRLAQARRDGVQDTMLADVTGEAGRKLGRGAVAVSSNARRAADALEDRQLAAAERIADDSAGILGGQKNAFDTLDDLIAERAGKAAANYDRAFFKNEKPVFISDRFKDLQDTDGFRRAFTRARRIASNEGQAMPTLEQLKKGTKRLTLKQAHYIKLGMDAAIDSGKKSGSLSNVEQGGLKKMRAAFKERLNSMSDDYRIANDTFAGDVALQDAVEEGMGIFSSKVNSNTLKKTLDEMTDGERDAFRIGVANAIKERGANLTDKANTAANLFRTPEIRNKLRLAFGDEGFERFERKVTGMRNQEETRGFMNVGSRTAPMSEDAAAVVQDAGILMSLLRGNPMAAGQQAVTRLGGVNEKVAGRIGRDLFDANLANQQQTLRRLKALREQEDKRLNRSGRIGRGLGIAGGQTTGLLLGD